MKWNNWCIVIGTLNFLFSRPFTPLTMTPSRNQLSEVAPLLKKYVFKKIIIFCKFVLCLDHFPYFQQRYISIVTSSEIWNDTKYIFILPIFSFYLLGSEVAPFAGVTSDSWFLLGVIVKGVKGLEKRKFNVPITTYQLFHFKRYFVLKDISQFWSHPNQIRSRPPRQ